MIGVVVAQLGLKFAAATRELPQNVNFAIKAATALSFLEAKGVGFEMAPSSAQLIAPQIAAAAQKFTVLVLCYR